MYVSLVRSQFMRSLSRSHTHHTSICDVMRTTWLVTKPNPPLGRQLKLFANAHTDANLSYFTDNWSEMWAVDEEPRRKSKVAGDSGKKNDEILIYHTTYNARSTVNFLKSSLALVYSENTINRRTLPYKINITW